MRGAGTRACGVETRLDARFWRWTQLHERASRRVSTRQTRVSAPRLASDTLLVPTSSSASRSPATTPAAASCAELGIDHPFLHRDPDDHQLQVLTPAIGE